MTVTVPTGWPAPTAGNTTSSLGARSYAGQTVTVSGLTLAANATFTITYGLAAAPTTGGPQVWSATERSTAGGALTALALSPSINVYARDGSGTLTAAPALVGFGSNGNTETFTYTAATGGTSNGSVTVVVPAGWNAPSTTAGNPGNTTASTGACLGRRADDHGVGRHALRRRDDDDRLRERRAGSNCAGSCRLDRLAGEVEGVRCRCAHEPRCVAEHHESLPRPLPRSRSRRPRSTE
mgnify:CR=1 FL=1